MLFSLCIRGRYVTVAKDLKHFMCTLIVHIVIFFSNVASLVFLTKDLGL